MTLVLESQQNQLYYRREQSADYSWGRNKFDGTVNFGFEFILTLTSDFRLLL